MPRSFLRLLACAGLLLPACLAHAQGAATKPGHAQASAVRPDPGSVYLGYWPELIPRAADDALAPVFSSVNDFLQPARSAEFGWGAPSQFERFRADAARIWQDLAQASSAPAVNTDTFAPQRPSLSLAYTGVGRGLGLMRFRIPWLLTPESAMRAMPTLSVATMGSLRMDLMAGSIGGRGGATAAYGQLVYHF